MTYRFSLFFILFLLPRKMCAQVSDNETEYNVYQNDVMRSGKKCWELVKLVSTSCKLIYAFHVPDSSPKLVARRRLIPVDKRQV